MLDDILGELAGFLRPDELNFVWERNLLGNRRCGAPFWWCELCNQMFGRAFDTWGGRMPAR